MKDRITIRLNEKEKAELNYLMESFGINNPSEGLKLSVEWVNNYIKNVTNMFFPNSYDIVLRRKLKTYKPKKKVFD